MTRDVDYIEIERIVYIWARYAGTRDDTKEGKHYNVNEIKNLIARLERFMKNPDSFNEGFEKEEDDPNREHDALHKLPPTSITSPTDEEQIKKEIDKDYGN